MIFRICVSDSAVTTILQLNVCITVGPPAPPRGRRSLELEAWRKLPVLLARLAQYCKISAPEEINLLLS